MTLNMLLMVQGLLLSFGAILVFVAIVYFGNILFDQEKLHRSLRINKNYKFLEFTIFKFSFYALIAFWCIEVLLQSWNVSPLVRDSVHDSIVHGTTFYGVRIIPMRLLIALMVYASIQMAWKYALVYFSKSDKYDLEADTQVVLTSILSYVVFAIAVLCGLLVSGVDFTGLAIIAGALSVGIGFGLQNVVNNFVSGIIILLEKTIKPGDRVLIKGHEGFVKRISLRYTLIETMLKEDVIIPNSDLMSTPIVNFEYDNQISKIKCNVGVAYDSDLDMVKETLVNVAIKHPEVLKDPLNKPMVYMLEFGENNLQFELSCVIQNVNKKTDVVSELNFAIAKAFRDNKITMSYPQRAVHLIRET